MRNVNVAKLKDQLRKYLSFAKQGEEIVVRDRNLPIAKLVPFAPENADEQELLPMAQGKMRLPEVQLDQNNSSRFRRARCPVTKPLKHS